MSIRIIRKALGLLIVDIVIIIGIFVLQFRTDSSIIEKIGNLQFTFSQIENNEKNTVTQNKFRMTYNGLNIFFDDQTPAKIKINDEMHPVSLINWERKDALTCILNFTENVKITFELASDSPNASLAIIADIPKSVTDIMLPFNYSSSMKIQKDDGDKVILNSKKAAWEVSAYSLDSGYFGLNKKDYIATYSIYDETQKFTFESIVDLPIANAAEYLKNITIFKNNLISSFKANTAESNLSEQVVVSYIAAQAENGYYAQAIEDIPSSLKKSKQRTYLSAPYLNTLAEMNKILEKTVSDYDVKLRESANSGSLDIFTVHNIANFMCIHNNPDTIKKLLQNAAVSDISTVSLAQATGILQVYVELVNLDSSYAQLLVPALDSCIERITESCSFENKVLTISENDTFLSVIQAVETGVAVMRYGVISGNETLQKAGYVLVNSYLTENSSYDLRTLANLYPVIAYDNWYYPHFKRIKSKDNNGLWAWTCAKDITYEKDSDGTINLSVDFPEGLTHYIIVKGIPSFSSIYIYNMAFRTDPRFETYNSSGYVYKQSTETLLLKSRHKSQIENVRLEYHEKPAVKQPVVKETAPAAESTKTPAAEINETVETKVEPVKTETVETPAPEVAAPVPEVSVTEASEPAEVTEVTTEPETVPQPVVEESNSKKRKRKSKD